MAQFNNNNQPTWLQLFDNGDHVQSLYVANSIPKFVLINKQANIVSLDAAFASTGVEIENLLK